MGGCAWKVYWLVLAFFVGCNGKMWLVNIVTVKSVSISEVWPNIEYCQLLAECWYHGVERFRVDMMAGSHREQASFAVWFTIRCSGQSQRTLPCQP